MTDTSAMQKARVVERFEFSERHGEHIPYLDGAWVRYSDYASLESENASLRKKVKEMEAELDEAVNWNDIVDRHGLDQFDDLAERWLAMEGIQRVHNAVASVFSKWANDDLMGRFKQHMSNAMQMSFVEGCLVGIRTAEARATRAEAEAAALRKALEGVVRVADRKTVEFDAARSALKSAERQP